MKKLLYHSAGRAAGLGFPSPISSKVINTLSVCGVLGGEGITSPEDPAEDGWFVELGLRSARCCLVLGHFLGFNVDEDPAKFAWE